MEMLLVAVMVVSLTRESGVSTNVQTSSSSGIYIQCTIHVYSLYLLKPTEQSRKGNSINVSCKTLFSQYLPLTRNSTFIHNNVGTYISVIHQCTVQVNALSTSSGLFTGHFSVPVNDYCPFLLMLTCVTRLIIMFDVLAFALPKKPTEASRE